jgi:hypothetical protein
MRFVLEEASWSWDGSDRAALFTTIRYWDDEMDWPAIDVAIQGDVVVSPSGALAHKRTLEGVSTACIPLPGMWSGPIEIAVGEARASVHFVVDNATHKAFFRDALEVERVDAAGLARLAPHAFPDTFFLEGVWDGIRLFASSSATSTVLISTLLCPSQEGE